MGLEDGDREDRVIDTLDDFKAYFITDGALETALTAVEAAKSIQVPRPAETLTHETRTPKMLQVLILPGPTEYVANDDGDSPLLEYIALRNVHVQVSYAGADPEAVLQALKAYENALYRAVKADHTFGSRFDIVLIRESDFSDAIEAQREGTIVQALLVEFTAKEYAP